MRECAEKESDLSIQGGGVRSILQFGDKLTCLFESFGIVFLKVVRVALFAQDFYVFELLVGG